MHAWIPSSCTTHDRRPPTEEVVAGLDWDKWLGPATKVPFSSRYIRSSWRAWFEFGTGIMGDWFCHNADAPYLTLGLQCPKKVEVESTGAKKLSFPDSARITFTFDSPAGGELKLFWHYGRKFKVPRPPEMEKESKQLDQSYGGTMIIGSKATAITESHAGVPLIVPFSKHREMQAELPKVNVKRSSHWDNWLRAIKGEEQARSNFDYSGRLTEVMHFGNIALHVNRTIQIDPVKKMIIGDPEAARLMSWPPPRAGWSV